MPELVHGRDDGGHRGRVVVIGGTGFIGGAAVAALRDAGHDVGALGSADVDLLADDAGDRLAAVLQPDDTVVFVSAKAPARTLDDVIDNLKMGAAVGRAVGAVEVGHVTYVSSDAVYADGIDLVDEISASAPGSLHGAMHLAREIALAGTGLPLCILRPTLVYGADDPHSGYGPNRYRRQAEADGRIPLFGGGEELRDHVAVDDVAEIVRLVVGHRSTGVLNVATGRSVSFREVADLVAGLHGGEVITSERTGPPTHRHFDVSRRIAAFPMLRMTQVEEGLARVHAATR